MPDDFEAHRPALLALAYRMLGDFGRAEDLVQEASIRVLRVEEPIAKPRAYFVRVVTRLCLNELSSARARREVTRGDRLPEPVSLERTGLDGVEAIERISMAFLVLLQRLTPAERAALLLHDVFDYGHREIGQMLGKSEAASRQLLRRARAHVADERRAFEVSRDEHLRLLRAFVTAAREGDVDALSSILADDVVLIADAGPDGGIYGRVRNLPGPLVGRDKVARFVATVGPQGVGGLSVRETTLNGQPAMLLVRDGEPSAAILLGVSEGRVRSVFMHADTARLGTLH